MLTNACWLFWPWLANSCFCLSFTALLRLNFPWRQRKLGAAEWTRIPPGVCISSFFCQGNVVQHLQRFAAPHAAAKTQTSPSWLQQGVGWRAHCPCLLPAPSSLFYSRYCGGTLAHGARCELCRLSGRAHRECSAEVCFTVYICDYQ